MADIAALRRTPATARPWAFPSFEAVIDACPAAAPADRPTAKELAVGLP